MEQSAEQQQNGYIEQALPTDGKNQGRDCSSCGLDCIDEHKQESDDRPGIDIYAGKGNAVSGGIGVIQKCVYQRFCAEIADCGHNQA